MVHTQRNRFSHISQEQRIEIHAFLRAWLWFRAIGRELWLSHTTISREVWRNSIDKWRDKKEYKPLYAHKHYLQKRYKANRLHCVLRKDKKMRDIIEYYLKQKWHIWWPDEIAGRLEREWYKRINTSTIYRFIRNEYPERQRYLRYKQKWYKTQWKWNKHIKIYDDVENISKRSDESNKRELLDDREWDSVLSNKKYKWWVITFAQRKSRYYLIKKIPNLKSVTVNKVINKRIKNENIKSATFDNWTEFSWISQLPIECFRANPYASYERGTNEKHNGILRWFLPKWCNINQWSDQEIQKIQDEINNKPRKILDYQTPYEVYHNIKRKYIS